MSKLHRKTGSSIYPLYLDSHRKPLNLLGQIIESISPLFKDASYLLVAIGSIIIAALFCSLASAESYQRTVYNHVNLVDPEGQTLPNRRIVVESGRFVCVSDSNGCPQQPGDEEIDLDHDWVTPGLIDTHVHLDFDNDAFAHQRRRLAYGITTVRDAATSQLDKLLAYREKAINEAPLPSVVVSALVSPDNARRFGSEDPVIIAARLKELGVDFIKLRDEPSEDAVMAIIAAAKTTNLPVYGHTWQGPPPRGISRAAVNAGLNGVAHLMSIPIANQLGSAPPMPDPLKHEAEFWKWRKNLWLTADPQALERFTNHLINKNVWLEPTLTMEHYWGGGAEQPYCGFLDTDRQIRFRETIQLWKPAPPAPSFPEAYAMMARFVKQFSEKGGIILAGSDNKCPGADLHEELHLLLKAGLTPRQVLRAATTDAAKALGIAHDRGRIAIGQRADFVIFKQDPLTFPNAEIETIVLRGYRHAAQILLKPERQLFEAKYQQARINGFIRWGYIPFAALLLMGISLRIFAARKKRIEFDTQLGNDSYLADKIASGDR